MTNKRQKFWVYLEHKGGELTPSSVSLLSECCRLAKEFDCGLDAITFGPLAHQPPADMVYDIRCDGEPEEYPGLRPRIISELVCEHKPILFLFPCTAESNPLAAQSAVTAGAGFVPGCTALRAVTGGNIIAVREVCDGKFSQILRLATNRMAIVTMLPESLQGFGIGDRHSEPEVVLINAELSREDKRIRLIKSVIEKSEEMDIAEADVIISGGRGMKNKGNFVLLRELAELLGGVVGGTRGAVERGWIERERQVGQTGKTVAPDLYFACGLSGAPQHLLGMKNSNRVVAVNTDPHAPILRIADFAIVGDLFRIIPLLVEMLKRENLITRS